MTAADPGMADSAQRSGAPCIEQRFRLLSPLRHLLPGAAVCAVLGAALSGSLVVRLFLLALAPLWTLLWMWQQRRQPVLVLGPAGYRVESAGRARFRVDWSEVRAVYCDRRERALYVDCGDRSRNLLLPPERGYGFSFSERDRLYQNVLEAAGERLREVPSLESIA